VADGVPYFMAELPGVCGKAGVRHGT